MCRQLCRFGIHNRPFSLLYEYIHARYTAQYNTNTTITMARTKAIAKQRLMMHPGDTDVKKRKTPKFKNETLARREVRRSQRQTHSLISKTVMKRLVKAAMRDASPQPMRMTKNAFQHIREMSSNLLVQLMEATECVRVMENKPKSIRPRHMRVARGLLGVAALEHSQVPVNISMAARRAPRVIMEPEPEP